MRIWPASGDQARTPALERLADRPAQRSLNSHRCCWARAPLKKAPPAHPFQNFRDASRSRCGNIRFGQDICASPCYKQTARLIARVVSQRNARPCPATRRPCPTPLRAHAKRCRAAPGGLRPLDAHGAATRSSSGRAHAEHRLGQRRTGAGEPAHGGPDRPRPAGDDDARTIAPLIRPPVISISRPAIACGRGVFRPGRQGALRRAGRWETPAARSPARRLRRRARNRRFDSSLCARTADLRHRRYTLRIGRRHAFFGRYRLPAARQWFMARLAPDVASYNEYHALLVWVGNRHCKRSLVASIARSPSRLFRTSQSYHAWEAPGPSLKAG